MKLFNLNQTTFENFDNSVNNYLSKAFGSLGIQYSDNQIFKVIFNGIKGIFQNIMVYIEDAFTEQNIETATRKKSLYSLAKLSGYEAYYGSAATGIISANLISNTNLNESLRKIYINNHSYIQDLNNGMTYIIYLQTDRYVFDINKPLMNYDFKVVQGVFNTSTYSAQGTTLETIHLTINGLYDKNYIKVYVNNKEWQQVSNLYDMTQDGEEYILSIGFENELDISFGNGVYGKLLSEGDNIKIEYITHNGEEGNVTNLNDIFKFVSNGYDYNGDSIDLNNYIKLNIENYISGGTNSDSVSTVRSMIGYNSRSNVLASIDNYILFLKHFSFLGNFNVWAEENSSTLMINGITNRLNNITDLKEYEEVIDSELILSDQQKQNILTVLNNSNNTFAGININFVDPIIYQYAIIAYVKLEDSYYKDIVEVNIQNSILKYFSTKNFNISFIAKSDILKYILDNVNHIKSLTLEIISQKNEEANKNGYYYKYNTTVYNNKVNYIKKRYGYEVGNPVGLDSIGNISLDSKLYMPLLRGGFVYYPDKNNTTNQSTIDTVNIIFI
jgi:hypothetical protein